MTFTWIKEWKFKVIQDIILSEAHNKDDNIYNNPMQILNIPP